MSSIVPNDEALSALASNPDEGIIVMLNLLKFKGKEGAEAYWSLCYKRLEDACSMWRTHSLCW